MRGTLRMLAVAVLALCLAPGHARADAPRPETAVEVLDTWYRLVLELVRHTPTYSPPVAARAFGYLGVIAYETVASGPGGLRSLAGQLNGLEPAPARGPDLDDAAALQAALATGVAALFGNTGPTGQRAIAAIGGRLEAQAAAGLDPETATLSAAHGEAVAAHVLDWSRDDGGAVVENMGFPYQYPLTEGPEHWVPTSRIAQQQTPLLPEWGANRTFAMPDGASLRPAAAARLQRGSRVRLPCRGARGP